jgi:hypothetical protein
VTDTTDRRDVTAAERPWLASIDTLRGLEELRRRLVSAGHPPSLAAGLVAWLNAKKHGSPDDTSAPTRSRYRRILAQMGDPSPPGFSRQRSTPKAA